MARELRAIGEALGNSVRQERIDRWEPKGWRLRSAKRHVRRCREIKRLTIERDMLNKHRFLGEGVTS